MTSTKKIKNDYCFNKYENYQHIYCKKCGHSMWFKKDHSATCGICGTLVYPSKRSEFKEKMEMKLRKELENHE